MSCCNRKLIITEEEKLDIMKLYGLLLEGEELPGGGYQIDFSNTFKSGYHSSKHINKAILTTELQAAKDWLAGKLKNNKGKLVFVKIDASESKVPNADAEKGGVVLQPYELSNKRAVGINNFLSGIFDGWVTEGLISQKPIFAFPEAKIGGPNWCPPYTKDETCVEKTDTKNDQKFTDHQYVRVQFLVDTPGMSAKCVEGLSITVSYNKEKNASFPCRGNHQCDEADFNVLLNRVPIGSVSLNNKVDGGSRTGTVTVTPQQAQKIAATNAKKVEVYLQCKYAACHSATPEISVSKNNFVLPGFPKCVPSISERDDFTMKHILTLDICGNVTQQNNDQKASLPDEQFIKKPADLVEGFLYYNEDTKQFEFSETELDEVVSEPFSHTIRHPLYGAGMWPMEDESSNPAKIYKIGCVAPDKANYGNYCIWDGPKIIYKTINRTGWPPYSDVTKIEKWKFGKNTGNVFTVDMGTEGPDGHRLMYTGPGKSSKWYNEDGTEKPQTDN